MSGFLLQNRTIFVTECDSYYKMRHLLQVATVCSSFFLANFITDVLNFDKTRSILLTNKQNAIQGIKSF